MPEWLKGADCKSAAYRYVGSNPTRPIFIHFYHFISFKKFYRPTIVFKIKYSSSKNNIRNNNKKIRD